jgi:HTH-type transcriptional regulator/antitoxin HipB
MNFPLRIADQLQPHLRALRKRRGLTQAQLGALVGVKQARIAEIEANPGAVSLDQLTRLLAALGGTLHLHADVDVSAAARVGAAKAVAKPPAKAKTKAKTKAKSTAKSTQPKTASRGVTIAAKKGVW